MKYKCNLISSLLLVSNFLRLPLMMGSVWTFLYMHGFWGGNSERIFLDVKVFKSYAPSNCSTTPRGIYRHHENAKKRNYEARICKIKRATFTSLVFSATGGMADR